MSGIAESQIVYDAPNTGWQTAVKLSGDTPDIQLPIELDKSSIIYTEKWIQHPDNFTALEVGIGHPSLFASLDGTIDIATGSNTLTGTDTDFLGELREGDYLVLAGEKYYVDSIASVTELELTSNFTGVELVGGSASRAKCYLTNEDGFSIEEGGLQTWSRHYATIPANRIEYATQSYTFPAYKTTSADTGNPDRVSFSKTIVAQVNYSYIRTSDPENDITFTSPLAILDPSDNEVTFVANDTNPTRATYEGYVTGGTYIQSDETKINRWRGNIWELKDIKVKAR